MDWNAISSLVGGGGEEEEGEGGIEIRGGKLSFPYLCVGSFPPETDKEEHRTSSVMPSCIDTCILYAYACTSDP